MHEAVKQDDSASDVVDAKLVKGSESHAVNNSNASDVITHEQCGGTDAVFEEGKPANTCENSRGGEVEYGGKTDRKKNSKAAKRAAAEEFSEYETEEDKKFSLRVRLVRARNRRYWRSQGVFDLAELDG